MATLQLPDFPVFDLTGGVRLDKSHYQLADNEVARAFNFEFREMGRVKRRRGYQQVGAFNGGNPATTTEHLFTFNRFDKDTGASVVRTYSTDRDNSIAAPHILRTTRLTANVATTDVSITVASTTGFAASGTIEIEGDVITYTAIADGTTFTVTAATIRTAHTAGHAVNQWRLVTVPGTGPNAIMGFQQVVLNGICIISGRAADWWIIDNDDAESITDATGDQVRAKSLVVYRDRTFAIPVGVDALQRLRMYFSARGNGISYTPTSDFFDINDDFGERPNAQKVFNDTLWIFKSNSVFRYNEVELKKTLSGVGAWNQKVVQEYGGVMYTFCPNGIFATTGMEAKYIGEPVERYWRDFKPAVETADNDLVTNTFAAIWDEKYWLYIGDISTEETVTDVVLVYDIRRGKWEVYSGFTDIACLVSMPFFQYGDIGNAGQRFSSLWSGDATRVYRLFENRYVDANGILRGNDIFQDMISDNAGNAINAVLDTKMYHFNLPQAQKTVGKLHILAESPGFTVSYRTEKKGGRLTPFQPLGTTDKTHHIFELPEDTKGYRLGLRIGFSDPNFRGTLNGFLFEDIYASF